MSNSKNFLDLIPIDECLGIAKKLGTPFEIVEYLLQRVVKECEAKSPAVAEAHYRLGYLYFTRACKEINSVLSALGFEQFLAIDPEVFARVKSDLPLLEPDHQKRLLFMAIGMGIDIAHILPLQTSNQIENENGVSLELDASKESISPKR